MYTRFFGLVQAPFSIAPDPRYLFMSERHREALAHLLYGVRSGGGFVLLTGEIGAGKTTVCRCFLEQVPARCKVAYIFNPKLTVAELLESICVEFRIPLAPRDGAAPATVKDYVDPLNRYLLASHAAGDNNVLIIDEAQNLSADVLEQLRLLTNLETNERKLLQIILIGQPELRAMLARPELEQLAQRVIARFHLDSLSESETVQYIAHRFAVARIAAPDDLADPLTPRHLSDIAAGARSAEETARLIAQRLAIQSNASGLPLSRALMQRIHLLTRGVPRRINLLCDRALLGAYAEGKLKLDRHIIDKAAREVFGAAPDGAGARPARRRAGWAVAGVIVVLGLVAWALDGRLNGRDAPANAVTKSAALVPAPKVGSTPRATPIAMPTLMSADVTLDATLDATAQHFDTAMTTLGRLWSVPAGAGDPCQATSTQPAVLCYRGTGGLAELRQLDRPAVLSLLDAAGRADAVLLVGLQGDHALLATDDRTHRVSLITLARQWRGAFTTLWRAPSGYRKQVGAGSRGAEVDWLATQLAVLNGAPAPTLPRVFDDALARQVRDFQIARGLPPDGVAGPQTFMQLNAIAGIAEPHLAAVTAAQSQIQRPE